MASDPKTVAEVEAWFREQVGALWPVAFGSLSLRRSPGVHQTHHTAYPSDSDDGVPKLGVDKAIQGASARALTGPHATL